MHNGRARLLAVNPHRVHVEGIIDEVVGEKGVDIDDKEAQHSCQDQLLVVEGNGLNNILKRPESSLKISS